jgi:hypothetical protein
LRYPHTTRGDVCDVEDALTYIAPAPENAMRFAIGVFGAELLFFAIRLWSVIFQTTLATWLFAVSIFSVCSLLSGFSFWLGLCYNARRPSRRVSIGSGFVVYSMANSILLAFGSSAMAQWISLGVLLVLPFILGKIMRQASSTPFHVATPVPPTEPSDVSLR